MGRSRLVWCILGLAWLTILGAGLTALWRYKTTAGSRAQAPPSWPRESGLVRSAEHATLLLFAHPHCPCTRASLVDLAALLGRLEPLEATALFVRPPGAPKGWERSELWRAAERIPGLRVLSDAEGREAGRFGATTSGQVVVYDSAGRLVFSGGITPSRGHPGPNAGSTRLAAALRGQPIDRHESRVFGCPLLDSP